MFKSRSYRKFHKLFGLIIGVQVLAWTTGGFVMSYFPIEKVRGEHNINNTPEKPLTSADISYPLENILAMQNGRPGVLKVTLKRSLGRPVYEVITEDGFLTMLDANSGEILSPIRKDMALSGFILLFRRFTQRDFNYMRPWSWKS
ncbi:MAG: PepSY domain-containing protein [bacterium]